MPTTSLEMSTMKKVSLEARVSKVAIIDKADTAPDENEQDAGNSNRSHNALKKPKRANKSGRDGAEVDV